MKNLFLQIITKAKSIDFKKFKETSADLAGRTEQAVKDIDWERAKERKDAFVNKLDEAAKSARTTFDEIQERKREKALQREIAKELKRQERKRKWQAFLSKVRLLLLILVGAFVAITALLIGFQVFYPNEFHQWEEETASRIEQQRLATEKRHERELEIAKRAQASVVTKQESPYATSDHDRNVQRAYQGINTSRGSFDVGRYCLNEEKKGVMTFEQCLGLTVAKIRGAR